MRDLILNNYPEKMICKYYNDQMKKLRMMENGVLGEWQRSNQMVERRCCVSVDVCRVHGVLVY